MENLAFLKTKIFSKYYSLFTNAILSMTIVFSLLGILGNQLLQSIAGFLVVFGLGLLFGQILLILNNANKSNKVGWYLVRLSYVTLFVVILGMLMITAGTVIASFYLFGGNSLLANVLFSSTGMTIWITFGICLSGLSYHTHSVEDVWM